MAAAIVFFAQGTARADEPVSPQGDDPKKDESTAAPKKEGTGGDAGDLNAEKPEDKEPNAPKRRRTGLVLVTTFGTGFVAMSFG